LHHEQVGNPVACKRAHHCVVSGVRDFPFVPYASCFELKRRGAPRAIKIDRLGIVRTCSNVVGGACRAKEICACPGLSDAPRHLA
jgi:hypothetical protein